MRILYNKYLVSGATHADSIIMARSEVEAKNKFAQLSGYDNYSHLVEDLGNIDIEVINLQKLYTKPKEVNLDEVIDIFKKVHTA